MDKCKRISNADAAVRNRVILTAMRSGAFVEDVAKTHGMTPRAVKSICQVNGVKTAGQWRTTKPTRQRKMSRGDLFDWINTQCILIENGCFIWTGFINEGGYGRARLGKALVFVHRFMYERYHGVTLTRDQCVCHKCDTPGCCRREHLWIGSSQDNADDRDKKGRNINYCGENHGGSKLKNKDVLEIKDLIRCGRMTSDEIAAQYGAHGSTIHLIKHGKQWKSVP